MASGYTADHATHPNYYLLTTNYFLKMFTLLDDNDVINAGRNFLQNKLFVRLAKLVDYTIESNKKSILVQIRPLCQNAAEARLTISSLCYGLELGQNTYIDIEEFHENDLSSSLLFTAGLLYGSAAGGMSEEITTTTSGQLISCETKIYFPSGVYTISHKKLHLFKKSDNVSKIINYSPYMIDA